jgi:hypothetical protein
MQLALSACSTRSRGVGCTESYSQLFNLNMKLLLTPICLLLGLSVTLVPTIASAQYNNTFGGSSDNRDPFNRASGGDTSGLLRIINEAQLNGRNNSNYGAEQRDQINSATEDFRAQRLRLLRESNKKTTPAANIKSK